MNSTGINSKNNATKNSIRNQNKPCPLQVISLFSTIPVDSKMR